MQSMKDVLPINKPQQRSTKTFRGRNLALMRAVDLALQGGRLQSAGEAASVRILSFGCSDGSEILDLAEIMPDAEIAGCDINPRMLSAARQKCPQAVILIENPSELSKAGPFDAVFALNVLCNYPKSAGLDNVTSVYPFQSFDTALEHLDSALRPGGFLVLYNAQYFLEDAKVASRYEPHIAAPQNNGWIEKALPDGSRATNVFFSFRGKKFDRGQWVRWLREPKTRETVDAHRQELEYWHEWTGPAFSNRSTQTSIWKKLR